LRVGCELVVDRPGRTVGGTPAEWDGFQSRPCLRRRVSGSATPNRGDAPSSSCGTPLANRLVGMSQLDAELVVAASQVPPLPPRQCRTQHGSTRRWPVHPSLEAIHCMIEPARRIEGLPDDPPPPPVQPVVVLESVWSTLTEPDTSPDLRGGSGGFSP